MVNRVGNVQSLEELAEYHNDITDSINSSLPQRFKDGDARFNDYTLGEFQSLLHRRRVETDFRSCLALMALIEAAFRVDFRIRVKRRKKDSLSKAFRTMKRQGHTRIRFDDLLKLWIQNYPAVKQILGELRSALHFRHWLAHGRHWKQPTNGKFDYHSMYALAEAILKAFPFQREL